MNVDEQRYDDAAALPAAMVLYYAARMVRVSKHAGGRQGKAHGKQRRHDRNKARRAAVAARSAAARHP